MAELLWTDFVIHLGLCNSGSALPMESVLVNRRAGEPSLWGSRWPLNVVLPDAMVVCLIISVLLLEWSCIYLAREMV